MVDLFAASNIGGLKLKNHFFRSATFDGKATEKGYLTEDIYQIYRNLAEGGIGTIITGYTFVCQDEQPISNMMGIYNDSFIEEYQALTEMIHKYSVNVIMQLVYGGSCSQANMAKANVWGPSAVKNPSSGITPKAMTKEDIKSLIQYFVDAARRVKSSGFDGVQLHAAHGYLLSQFLSPIFNHRTDEYGGNIENRARLIMETYSAIRKEVGRDFPIMIKINSTDDVKGGLTFHESLQVSKKLADMGIDAIEVSGGNCERKTTSPETESYFRDYAIKLSEMVPTPIILTGGNRSIAVIQQIADNSNVRYFGFSRPLLRDPNYIQKLKEECIH